MNAATLKAHALPALLAGVGRQPLSHRAILDELGHGGDPATALKILSLTGQALRFERPLPPPGFSIEAGITDIQDRRPILPDPMRRPLLRLLSGKRPSDDLALALAWAFNRCKIRPHPFDLPRLDAFVRAHAELLGRTAQHWAEQQKDTAAQPRGYFDADQIDETTWKNAPPARRARYIAEQRKQDPAAARTLVESVWTQESADARVRLLAAFESGLNSGDQLFLEGLLKDRAPRVRSLAQRFLARLSGRSGEHPALMACLERIRRSTAGLLKKRPVLALELPATLKEHEARGWIRETFAEVSCEELASALELTETEMIDAAEKDANLLLALAWMATQDGRLDLLEQLTAGPLADAWEQLSQCGVPDLAMMPFDQRQRWAAILIGPYGVKPPASYPAWSWLHRSLEGPAPEVLIDSVLRSPRWLGQLLDDNKFTAEWMELLAALCRSSHRARLRALIAPLDPPLTLTALTLLDILDSMEKAGHDERTTTAP